MSSLLNKDVSIVTLSLFVYSNSFSNYSCPPVRKLTNICYDLQLVNAVLVETSYAIVKWCLKSAFSHGAMGRRIDPSWQTH